MYWTLREYADHIGVKTSRTALKRAQSARIAFREGERWVVFNREGAYTEEEAAKVMEIEVNQIPQALTMGICHVNEFNGTTYFKKEHIDDIADKILYERKKEWGATALYRHFDADGQLLYIGITLNPPGRTRAHRQRVWWYQVTNITLEWFDTRWDAEEAEKKAIKKEKPKFNVVHNRR